MTTHAIFLPILAMVALTFVVMLRMFQQRIGEMKRSRIHPQAVATSRQAGALFTDCAAADNFRNLFELPVLFYVAMLVAAISGQVDAITLGLAWAFVLLRTAHSAIHCTYNKVMHRFRAYLLSGLALLLLWLRLGYGLLAG